MTRAEKNALAEAIKKTLLYRGTVVRCKDCKHYDSGERCCLKNGIMIWNEQWFCVDGERESNDERP